MPTQIKCGTCGTILKALNDDCPVCTGKENPPPVRPETELLFQEEKELRELKEMQKKRREVKGHGKPRE